MEVMNCWEKKTQSGVTTIHKGTVGQCHIKQHTSTTFLVFYHILKRHQTRVAF